MPVPNMNSIKATAHKAGVLYFLFMIIAIIGEFFSPTFMVHGDATATANNINVAEQMYRINILTGFVTLVIHIFLVVILYNLLNEISKIQAMLMVLLVSIGVAVALANLLNKFAPLVLLSGAEYLSVFSKPQLDALVLGFLRFHAGGAIVSMAFWGLWLFPFGILVIKSGFFPRILGILLMVAGFAYCASSFTSLVLPAYRHVVSQFIMPLYFGEVPIIFWLLIKGAKVPQPQTPSSRVN
jgi:hypothetical protein